MLVNRKDGENSVAPDVRMAVLQACTNGRHDGLQELGVAQFAEETQCGAANILVRVLQILSRR